MKQQYGFSMIEILIALSALIILASATAIAVSNSLSNSFRSKNQNLATQYAEQGMEIMKKMNITDYQTFSQLSGDYCLDKTCTKLDSNVPKCWKPASSCSQNIDNFFIRDVAVTQKLANIHCNNQNTEVVVTVSWVDGSCPANQYCQHTVLSSCFTNNSNALIP